MAIVDIGTGHNPWALMDLLMLTDLSFELQSGVNILVTGASGCGKSSLLRVLDKLWPHSKGIRDSLTHCSHLVLLIDSFSQ